MTTTGQTGPARAAAGTRDRRGIGLRAPITGVVLLLIVVLGTYYGWQSAFGDDQGNSASSGCETPTPTSSTPPTTPATTSPGTTAPAAALIAAVSTQPPTTVPTPTGLVLLPTDVEVNVYNATIRQGLANNTASVLRERGFRVGDVANDPLEQAIPEVAHLRAATADQPEVRLLIQHIPGAVIMPDGRTDATVDLVIGEAFVSLGDLATVTPVPIATSRDC